MLGLNKYILSLLQSFERMRAIFLICIICVHGVYIKDATFC